MAVSRSSKSKICVLVCTSVLILVVILIYYTKWTPMDVMRVIASIEKVPVRPRDLTWPNPKLDVKSLYELYHWKILKNTVACADRRRHGNRGDGGWEVCMDPPYTLKKGNCLVYSFGINNDWSFDDSVQYNYGCEIHAFDPSIKQEDHIRGKNIHFHNLGVGDNDQMNGNWKMQTVKSIMKDLGHTNKVIDFFKIDVEFSEWSIFQEMIRSGTFSKIKQLGVEYHIPLLRGSAKKNEDFTAMLRQHIDVLSALEGDGYKVFWHHTNPVSPYKSELTGVIEHCCQEIYYLNTKFDNANGLR